MQAKVPRYVLNCTHGIFDKIIALEPFRGVILENAIFHVLLL